MVKDHIKLRGFFRVQIVEDKNGKDIVVGDSGWSKNQVTNDGIDKFICRSMSGQAGSLTVSYIALGSGGAPAAADTALAGEIMSSTQRVTVSPSVVASKTLQLTAAFNSSASFLSLTSNLSNVGLFNSSTGGTLLAGNTFTSSSCASNQSVNVTYQLRFS